MSKAGFDILPIDFEGNKQRPYVHVVQLDLRQRSTWEFLEYLAHSRRPFHFHAAPPCGTASRARDVPMSENGPRLFDPKLGHWVYPVWVEFGWRK